MVSLQCAYDEDDLIDITATIHVNQFLLTSKYFNVTVFHMALFLFSNIFLTKTFLVVQACKDEFILSPMVNIGSTKWFSMEPILILEANSSR